MGRISTIQKNTIFKSAVSKSFSKNRRTFWQMLRDIIAFRYRPSLVTIIAFAITVAYVVIPSDIVPDDLLIVGISDDLLIILIFLKFLSKETHRYARYKALCRKCD